MSMVIEGMRRSIIGLGFTAIFTFAILTVITMKNIQVPVSTIWLNMLGSILLGIYFGIGSLIFEVEDWSPLKQTIVHFGLSIFIWLPIALLIGWIPMNGLSILFGIVIFIITYVIFWLAIYSYLKKQESNMNHSLKK